MSVLYYAGGTQWWCKGCRTTVRATETGHGKCQCKTSPSPWEPVCRKCLHVYRDTQHTRGLKRFQMPFSNEKIWRLTLFGWTAEWAYGSCKVDTSRITRTKSISEPISDYDAYLERKADALRQIQESVPEKVQLAALGEIEARSKKGMKPGEFPVSRVRGTSRRRG